LNWEIISPLLIAALAALPATIAAIASWRQSRATHLAVNSRMEELLALARKEATAQATLDEQAAERQRKGDAAIDRANIASPKGETP